MMQIFEVNRKNQQSLEPSWLELPVLCMTTEQPSGLTTLFMCYTGGTSPHLTKYLLYYTLSLPNCHHSTHILLLFGKVFKGCSEREIARKCRIKKIQLNFYKSLLVFLFVISH